MPILRRESDGAGINAPNVESIDKDAKVTGSYPTIGEHIKVSRSTAGMFTDIDYWVTSEVTEILEERDQYVRFKTKNSIYEIINNQEDYERVFGKHEFI